jgi:hypothetical protein
MPAAPTGGSSAKSDDSGDTKKSDDSTQRIPATSGH